MHLLKRKRLHRKKRPKKKKIFLYLLILTIPLYFFLLRPVLAIQSQSKKIIRSADQVKAAFSRNDLDLVKKELNEFKKDYAKLEKESEQIYWMQYIPIVRGYILDYKNGIEAGGNLINAGLLTVDAIAPYADLIGFKKGEGGSFTEKPAEDRIQTAVLTLDKLTEEVDGIAEYIDDARKNLDEINIDHYPESIAGKQIRSKIKNIVDQFDGVSSLFVDAKPLIKRLPSIMGVEEEKIYIVLFQNDKELRPTGGFITAYAIFRINQGKLRVERSQDIYSLDDAISPHPKAPREIAEYHKGVNKFYIRDSNLSPDFVESVKLFNGLYELSSNKMDYDGIITLDTQVLVDALGILGDTEVRGTVFSANEDKRCDCPQVIYKLLDEIDRPVNRIREDRKGILGDLLFSLVQKALGSSPSQYWGKLSQVLLKDLNQKHILIYFTDKKAQDAVEKLNFAGRIRQYSGDYLHINDTNFAGAKSNLFVKHKIESTTTIKDDGEVRRDLTIEYRNPYKHSDCNLERGGLCINATLRNWLRIYVPEGSELIKFTGSETKVQSYNELGKTVFEGFLRVRPKGKSEVKISYILPGKIQDSRDYSLLIQKQPGTDGHDLTVILNGKKIKQTTLIQDLELP